MFTQLKTELNTSLRSEFKYPLTLTILILTAFLIVWSTLYLRVYMDTDLGWLLECLDRFMAGGTYTQDFYESNPPLSFWIYIPAYPLYTYMSIDPKISVFAAVLAYLLFSNFAFFSLLRKEKHFNSLDLFIIMSAIIMSQSWVAGEVYGSKDHLIAAFLLPFSLYQYRLTRGLKTGTLLATSSIIMGGIAVCLKPHYALIPALFFAHRLYTTRSLIKTIVSPDFLGTLLIGIFYLLLIWLFTPEFLSQLPQLVSLYSVEKPYPLHIRYHYAVYAILAALGSYFIFSENNQKTLMKSVYIFSALSLVCIIPYILQNKGFHYQTLPFLCYGATAGFIAIYGMIKELTKCKSDIAIWGTCATMVVVFGGYTYGNKIPKLTKEQFKTTPIIKTIDELAWNRVYANYYYKHVLSSLPKISSLKKGSRFGELWPLTGLTLLTNKTDDPELQNQYKKQMYNFVGLIVEDMIRYKPSVILIPQYRDFETHKPTKDYYNFLIKHDGFKENMINYTFYDTIVFDISHTPEGKNADPMKLISHDIYVLNHDNTL